jgi:hypothetical protein
VRKRQVRFSQQGSGHGSIDVRGITLNFAFGACRRRAALVALLTLTLLATLVVAESASARTLSARLAENTATRLVQKQLKNTKRDLVEARITVGERVNSGRFTYLYDDLSRQGDVCTGKIDVRLIPPGGSAVRAKFVSTHCAAPGDEALAFRTAARSAGSAFLRVQPALLRSVRRFVRNSQPCETLDVPSNRQAEATLILAAGLTQAANRPIGAVLDDYAATLQSLAPTDPQLAKGAAAWRDYVDGVRALPALAPSACAVLAEWAANGYTDETAPVDFAALTALLGRLRADGGEIRRTARYLARLGIDPVTAVEFTLDDIAGAATSVTDSGATAAKLARRLAR